ncbi:MAG: nuclear transport factor 2 family protein [Bacteroidales bacterium]|nr:nuclear transport factor 2 family protein [Bacteroidales bacterium]
MKKLIIIIFIGYLAVSCCNENTSTSFDLEQEREKVALVLEKYVIANEKQDLDLVKEIWASSPDIVVIGTNSGEKIIGWEEIRSTLQRQFDSFEETYISIHNQIIEVNETGNTAWFSEIVNYNYIYQGEAKQFEGLRFTGVLEKINDEWYIVQSHMSIPGSPD